MKTIYLSHLIICLLLCRYGNTLAENSGSFIEITTYIEYDHDKGSEKMELNKGEKWKVNKEMMPHVRKAEEILEKYLTDENGKDHKELAHFLNEQNNKLISSCTMKGKSHDELHKWLHSHILLVKELANTETSVEAAEIIKNLSSSFETFNEYFE